MVAGVLKKLSGIDRARAHILDLSAEAGHFALAVAARESSTKPVAFYGLDRDPQALAVTRRLLAFQLEESPPRRFQLRTSCQDSLTQEVPETWPPNYDVVIGNPPWRPLQLPELQSLPAEFRCHLRARPDVFLAFMLRAHELLAPGGLLCHVIPSSFLFNRNAAAVRRLLLDEYEILNLTLYPQSSFVEKTCLIPVSFLARKKAAQASNCGRTTISYPSVSLGGKNRPRRVYRARVANVWRQLPHSVLHPLARADCMFLLRSPGEPLEAFGTLQTGAKLGRKRRFHPPRNFLGIHARGIQPFHACSRQLTTYPRDEARFDRGLVDGFLDCVKVVYKDLRYMTHRRFLVAAVAGPGVYPVSTASFFAPEAPSHADFFAALLNSSVANAWYKLHDASRSIKICHLRSLPVMDDATRWQRIGELGQECTRERDLLHRYLSCCGVRNEDRLLAKRFPQAYARLVKLQQAIDEEIFRLYGLSDRRRKVILHLSEARVF
jgi:hypothetical protein